MSAQPNSLELTPATFQPPVNHYPKMAPTISRDHARKLDRVISSLLYNGAPSSAEKLSCFVKPSAYRGLLRQHYTILPVFQHIMANYPQIITDDDIAWLLKPKHRDFLKIYISRVARSWTVQEIKSIIDSLGYEEAAPFVEFSVELIEYLFKIEHPLMACEILSDLKSPEATRTLMRFAGELAFAYFDRLAQECFSDFELYWDAVKLCDPNIPETIAELYSRGTPGFAPFEHYLSSRM